MLALQTERFLKLGPVAAVVKPQTGIHGFQYAVGLGTIWGGVLTYNLGYAGGEKIATVVISRRVGHGSAAVI